MRIKERKIGIAGAVLTVLATNEANGGQDLLIKLEVVLSDYFSSKVRSVEGLAKGQSISIDFPARLGAAKADDPGYLVMPCGVGVMCNFSGRRNSLRFERLIYSGGQMGYAMPLFGVVKNDQAMAGIVQTPFDCMLKTWINDGKEGEYSITPCWLFEEGRLDYEREVRYYLLGKAGYVEIAKTYREYVITAGKYKSFCGKN